MKRLFFFLAIVALSSTAQAGTYQIVYEQQLPGAENYVHIDPIVGEDGLLAGFVYCDSANQQVIIERFGVDSNVVIDYDRRPVKSINYVSGDTVVVYVLLHSAPIIADWLGFQLGKVVVTSTSLFDTVVTPPVQSELQGFTAGGGACSVMFRDISFNRDRDNITGVIYESTSNDHFYYSTMGWGDEFREIHKLYDLNLIGLRHSIRAKVGRYGNLVGTDEQEHAHFSRHKYSYDFTDDPEYPVTANVDDFRVIAEDSTSVLAGRNYSASCDGYALFVDKFSPAYDYDEMIFFGNSEDLLGLHGVYGERKSHVACYRFTDTGATENWYTEISGISLDYVYEPQHYIAGFHGPDRVIALNYWSGRLCDSVDLDRVLLEPTFYETGVSPSLLHLVGRVHDTIFGYGFQTPTDADDPVIRPNLPSGFALHQNYPNPFNNETVLSFANGSREHLTLSVYNVLGRKIAVLYDQQTAAGDHSVSWNGTDENGRDVASGIYFARLRSETGSSAVKMILLK